MELSRNYNNLSWLLAGAAAGVAIGVLFSPKSGCETREMIGQRVRDVTDKATDAVKTTSQEVASEYQSLREQATAKLEEGKNRVQEQVGRVKAAAQAAKQTYAEQTAG